MNNAWTSEATWNISRLQSSFTFGSPMSIDRSAKPMALTAGIAVVGAALLIITGRGSSQSFLSAVVLSLSGLTVAIHLRRDIACRLEISRHEEGLAAEEHCREGFTAFQPFEAVFTPCKQFDPDRAGKAADEVSFF